MNPFIQQLEAQLDAVDPAPVVAVVREEFAAFYKQSTPADAVLFDRLVAAHMRCFGFLNLPADLVNNLPTETVRRLLRKYTNPFAEARQAFEKCGSYLQCPRKLRRKIEEQFFLVSSPHYEPNATPEQMEARHQALRSRSREN